MSSKTVQTKDLNFVALNTSTTQVKNRDNNNDKAPNIDGTKAFDTIVFQSDDISLKTGCVPIYDFVYLFIWGLTSLSTLYRSYHNG